MAVTYVFFFVIYESLPKSKSMFDNRKSQDNELNNYGKLLLNLCTMFNLCLMNGMCKGDLQGCYTYISSKGCSVNDYFILSQDLYDLFSHVCEMTVLERIDSDHMPVHLQLVFPKENIYTIQSECDDQYMEKITWRSIHANNYIDMMKSDEIDKLISEAIELIDTNINDALDKFNECIKKSAESLKTQIRTRKVKKQNEWFDHECKESRKNVRKFLRKFRKSLKAEDKEFFCKTRRDYKNMLKQKKKEFNNSLLDKLITSVKDQKEFWDTMHLISPKRKFVKNNISIEIWFQHFKTLLETNDDDINDGIDEEIEVDDNSEESFNRPITRDEILLAIRKLKNKKAAGPDGLVGELLKNGGDVIVDFFVRFFNVLFKKGVYPDKWSEAIVLPLFKKGNVNDPNNYRGISLCDASSKVFSIVINRRLQEWIDENNITGEFQAGFKRNYSTIDNMFTLFALIQKQFSLNRKMYIAFIDFEKAFDSINRNLLWPILIKNGIKGKLYSCIRSMYRNIRIKVRSGSLLTDYIICSRGVKQGDVCSPLLFCLFINELALTIIENGRHGALFGIDYFELFIMLLADDIVLLSETVIGLQSQLNSLQQAAHSLQLKVNVSKSNIIVFRKGGYLSSREKWTYDGVLMPVVNAYKYLGILFSTKLSFTAACCDLTSKAKNALLSVMQKLRMLNNNNLNVFVKLFDCQIQPVAQYGAELWGLDTAAMQCEKLHLFALKKFLGVDRRTPNEFVYGETDRYPIYINSAVKCIRYWLKITKMSSHRLPYKAYKTLFDLDIKGKQNWVSNVRCKLFEFGYGFVWLNQGVEDIKSFLYCFRNRLIDCRWQDWNSHIQNSDRFCFYRTFCSMHDVKPYLRFNIDKHLKFLMARFRMGVSDIATHYYRYKNKSYDNLICPLCHSAEEDEYHFVLCCSVLSDLRAQFIPFKYYRNPNRFRLCLLLASRNESVVRNLSVYLYKAFQLRSSTS